MKGKVTGYSIGEDISNNPALQGGLIILVIAIGLMIFAFRKKILELIERIILKHPDNHVRGLIGKKVYVSHGDYIGKIGDVMLGRNRIYGLKIKLDKKFGNRKIAFKWKHVKSCGEIVIIESGIINVLNEKPGDENEKREL